MVRRALLIGIVLLAGCARSEDAAVVADMNELQPVERVRTPEQDDQQVAIGYWRQSLQDDEAALEFGPQGTTPLFSLRCNARRNIFLQRHGAVPGGDLPMMLISIGSETRRLAVTAAGGTVPMLRASVAPSDTLLDTLSRAAEPIQVRIGDALLLTMPPSPEIGQFLARCQSGESGRTAAAEGNETEAEPAAANEVAPAEATPAAEER